MKRGSELRLICLCFPGRTRMENDGRTSILTFLLLGSTASAATLTVAVDRQGFSGPIRVAVSRPCPAMRVAAVIGGLALAGMVRLLRGR